jgi:hypothetical protein
MSIFDARTAVFPNNAASLIQARISDLYGDELDIYGRRLRLTDNTKSVGVAPDLWVPDESSFEFRSLEPTVSTYTIWIQCFVKNSDEEEGVKEHSVLSKVIRTLLYRDGPLAVGLNQLSVAMMGSTERIQRRGFRRAQYLSTELQGNWLFLNTLEYYIETETK